MKGKFATLSGITALLAVFAGNASAHPGHAAMDVLSAPLAGPDHIFAFATVSVLGALAAARLAVYLVERRQAARLRRRRSGK